MTVVDDEIIRKVKQWLDYADEDIRLAQHGMTLSTGVPYRLIAYHAQQCAEKCLKAYLVYFRTDFPYTHNISHLLELCEEKASTNNATNWIKNIKDAEELTFFAITTRYPGTEEEVTNDEAIRAINIAIMVREAVRKTLKDDGLL